MALDEVFLNYPRRRHGMDHDRYPWSNIFNRPDLSLPNGSKVGLLITIPVEFFPLNPTGKPFKAPGSMVTTYPDFRHYTTRDYGNRVGIFRLMKILDDFGLKANMAVNSEVAVRYPYLLAEIVSKGHEIVAHGMDMDTLHYSGMDPEEEEKQVTTTQGTLRKMSGQPVIGWMSPAYSESFFTPDMVRQHGCKYICDWANDDLPYNMNTSHGDLLVMPVSQEISDRQIIINYHQTENSFCQQVCDQMDYLYTEAKTNGPRILSLTLTPYISGLPFRISAIQSLLTHIIKHPDVVNMTGSDVVSVFNNYP